MSLIGTIGALMAVVARPHGPWDRIEKLAERVERLSRSQARLIERIEDLERELDLQQSLTAHWKGEAQRLARENREQREMALREYQEAAAQQQTGVWPYCNCVPSRAQVWGAQHGLVKRLNQGEG